MKLRIPEFVICSLLLLSTITLCVCMLFSLITFGVFYLNEGGFAIAGTALYFYIFLALGLINILPIILGWLFAKLSCLSSNYGLRVAAVIYKSAYIVMSILWLIMVIAFITVLCIK